MKLRCNRSNKGGEKGAWMCLMLTEKNLSVPVQGKEHNEEKAYSGGW